MTVEKMIDPPSRWMIRNMGITFVFSSLLGAGIAGFSIIIIYDDNPITAAFFFIPGLVMFVGSILLLLQRVRWRKTFLRTKRTTEARVIDRKIVDWLSRTPLRLQKNPKASGQDGESEIQYQMVIEFTASHMNTGSRSVTLEGLVCEHTYEEYPPGSTMTIHYAMDNPRIVLPESEYADFVADT